MVEERVMAEMALMLDCVAGLSDLQIPGSPG